MAYKELKYIIENLQKKGNILEFNIKNFDSVLFEVLENKGSIFEEFKSDIRIKWEAFEKKKQK